MELISSFIIIAISALIHASFQLSISVLTLMSSHTIGKRRSQRRLLVLTNAYTAGVGVMTIFLLSTSAYIFQLLLPGLDKTLLWILSSGLLVALGVSVWLFYYRREPGTILWIPRSFADYIAKRSKKTRQGAEAFSLGLSTVVGELLFLFVPLVVAAFTLVLLPPVWQAVGIALYTVVSLATLFTINGLIGSGHSISRIQRWRETNKGFLQFAAGSGLILLGVYIYVEQVLVVSVLAAAGGV